MKRIRYLSSMVLAGLVFLAGSAGAQVTSVLWGVNGEAWDPTNSILNDFSDVGYMNGDVAIPTNWPVGTDVTDYGAIPNDEISDVQAFRDAISNCPPNHAIFVPAGTYWITDVIQVTNQNNFVLRGEDMFDTVLYFPTNMSVLYPEDETGYRYSVIAPPAVWWMQNGTNMNIENISIEFSEDRMVEHFNHDGRAAIHYQGVKDSWIRNVYIKNANDGVILSGDRRITAMNIVLDQYEERASNAENTVGHHGLVVRGARYCLFHNCFITGRWQHDLISADKDIHNVYSRIRAIDPQIDHHAMGADPADNLWTDIDTGEGLRIWEQGGNVSGYFDTIWNVYETTGTGNTNRMFTPDPVRQNVVVGLDNDDPTSIGSTWWHEAIDPESLIPQNIYLAQLEKVGKPIPGPLIDFELHPADPKVFVAVDDTYIDKDNGDANFSWSGMPTRRAFDMEMKYGIVHDRQPWMKFDLTGSAFTNVEAATLSVYCNQYPSRTVEIGAYGYSNDSWSQDTLTWSNKPVGTASLLSSVMVTNQGAAYEWDVTDFVNEALTNGGDQVVTIYLREVARTDASLKWRTHEGAVWHPTLTLEPDKTPPAVPTNLTAAAGDETLVLVWDDNVEDDLAGYSVYRATTPGGYGAALTNGLAGSVYLDHAVSNNVAYYYVVTASDTNGNESAQSREVIAVPAQPGNNGPEFTANPIVETNALEGALYSTTLADDAGDPESDPMYFSKVSGPTWLNVATNGALSGMPGETDTGTNRFMVRVDAAGGGDTAELQIVVEVDTVTPPAAPSGLAALAGVGSVSLSWNANTEEDLAGYTVYRSTTSSNGYSAVKTALSTNVWFDTTVENETTYYYAVTATDIYTNESAVSQEVSATPSAYISTFLPATQNGNFEGGATRDVSETLQLRNAFDYNGNDDYAYLRFVIDAANNTIGGVAVDEITSVKLNLTALNNNYDMDVWALDDLADPGAGFLTETTWTDSNLTDTNAPHGNTDIGASELAAKIGEAAGDGASSTPLAIAIEMDMTEFQRLITNSSNNEITLILSGAKNHDDTVASLDNTSGYGVPTLEIKGESILTGYDQWAAGWSNDIGMATNDFDSDGMNNLYEYAFDGNPTNGLPPSNLPVFSKSGPRFLYVHPQRSDDTNLIYTVETTTNLLDSGAWTNQGYTVTGTNVTGETLNFVTNDVDTVADEKFIRLKIEQ